MNMMRPVQWTIFFMAALSLLLCGCNADPLDVDISGIELHMKLERFDRDLFEMDQDTMEVAIGALYQQYDDFYDVFNVHVISIGPASSRRYSSYLSMFINDPTNREVYEYTNQVYASADELESQLSEGFKHYIYHYPDSLLPRVVAYVSRFNQGLFTVGSFVGVGLDQYLGSDCSYYQQMGGQCAVQDDLSWPADLVCGSHVSESWGTLDSGFYRRSDEVVPEQRRADVDPPGGGKTAFFLRPDEYQEACGRCSQYQFLYLRIAGTGSGLAGQADRQGLCGAKPEVECAPGHVAAKLPGTAKGIQVQSLS
jgi:hypothetical protein